jgi:hypothetical protein
VPPQDDAIVNKINNTEYANIKFKANESLINYIGKNIDNVFIDASLKMEVLIFPNQQKTI